MMGIKLFIISIFISTIIGFIIGIITGKRAKRKRQKRQKTHYEVIDKMEQERSRNQLSDWTKQ